MERKIGIIDKCIALCYIINMYRKPALVWDKWNKEHIKKHGVSVAEVKEAYENEYDRTPTYKKREAIFGQTKKGRLITIAVSYERQPGPYVLTARDTSKKERRDHYEKNKVN